MAELKLGMVGLDTSHCGHFARLLHDESSENYAPGGRVVSAFPGGSRDFSSSVRRVDEFTRSLKEEYGVRITGSIEEAAEGADAVFLTSVDGRQHLEQFRKLAPFGKPVFIDKPFAVSVAAASEILNLSDKHGAPVFSSSAVRYAAGLEELGAGDNIRGCQAFGPCAILEDYPGYFWYGVHSAEVLFSKMGAGCVEVSVCRGEDADIVSGLWDDGRTGGIYGYRIKGLGAFGCTVFSAAGAETATAKPEPPYYSLLLARIMEFFRTGRSPVSAGEMLEVVGFLEAAGSSRDSAGAPVKINHGNR